MLQSFGIGYLALHPDGQVRVHSDDPRPVLRVKPDAASGFRRYDFVCAVLGLDPVGKLGLNASDYKVHMFYLIISVIWFRFNFMLFASCALVVE